MPDIDIGELIRRTRYTANQCGLEINVQETNHCFSTNPQSEFVQDALKLVHRREPMTVPFGTDGGVFSEMENLIVFGPGSVAQAHTRDEWISIEQLTMGTEMYAKMIRHWCCN